MARQSDSCTDVYLPNLYNNESSTEDFVQLTSVGLFDGILL